MDQLIQVSVGNQFVDSPSMKTGAQKFSVDVIKSLYYDCQFRQLIDLVEEANAKVEDNLEVFLLVAKAYYELNRKDKCLEIFKALAELRVHELNPTYAYTMASVSYFDRDWDRAKQFFSQMMELTEDPYHVCKALLGLANIAYSEQNQEKTLTYLKQLKDLSRYPLEDELLLSILVLEGNYHLHFKVDRLYAREKFEKAYLLSSRKGLLYFQLRSLYSMAKWNHLNGKLDQLKGTVYLLNSLIRQCDSRFLGHLVNEEFIETDLNSQQQIKLCEDSKALTIGVADPYTISLKRYPTLYKFTKRLINADGYVSKRDIGETIWDKEEYKPRVHDPRIYDIVSRLRKLMELTEKRPVVLLANHKGYKFSSGDDL